MVILFNCDEKHKDKHGVEVMHILHISEVNGWIRMYGTVVGTFIYPSKRKKFSDQSSQPKFNEQRQPNLARKN